MKPQSQSLPEEVQDLLYQTLETEMGGVKVYETAIECAVNEDLKEEWEEYLEQTRKHVQIATDMVKRCGLDPSAQTPGRGIVRDKGASLVQAMRKALSAGRPEAAELVACECVVEAETKDHLNWELIGESAKKAGAEAGRAMKEAHDEVEDEEDEHLYHTQGWCRELWMKALGMPAVLPPPEERKDVKTAIGAARAKQNRRPSARPPSRQAGASRGGNGGPRSKSRSSGKRGSTSRSARP